MGKMDRIDLTWKNKKQSVYFRYNKQGNPVHHEWVESHDPRINTSKNLKFISKYGDPKSEEILFENFLIQGDNLIALNTLVKICENNPSHPKFKLIYLDPPYNTGNRINKTSENAFFYYNDQLEHDIWLSMMKDRIIRLKKLMHPKGFLVIQIDDHEYARLYLLLAEIFGEKNLKTIVVKMAEPTGMKINQIYKSGTIPKLKEYLIFAGINGIGNLKNMKIPKIQWDEEYNYLIEGISKKEMKELSWIINCDSHRTKEQLNKAIDIVKRFQIYLPSISKETSKKRHITLNSHFKKNNIRQKVEQEKFKFENAWRIFRTVESSSVARRISDEKKAQIAEDCFLIQTPKKKLYIIKTNYNDQKKSPRFRILLAQDYLSVFLGDIWVDIKTTGLDKEGLVTFRQSKKPEALLCRIIEMTTAKGDFILDCFAGSGTTGAVAHKIDRKWGMIEIGNHINEICIPRLSGVLNGEDQSGISKKVSWKGGGGYTSYILEK
jgi:adenine-specific DNA-methyltransferase